MNTNNPLVGQFYFGFKQELMHIVAQVNHDFMLVAEYTGLGSPIRRMVPLSKIQGYVLYESKDAAMESLAVQS